MHEELERSEGMADDIKPQLDRMEDMLAQLIDIVGKTNGKVTSLEARVASLETEVAALRSDAADIKQTVYRTDHSLNVMERRQDKITTRVENIEAEVEILTEGRQ